MDVREENIYIRLIEDCCNEVDFIITKTNFITNKEVLSVEGAKMPNRTLLEERLMGLLVKLQDLNNNIIK